MRIAASRDGAILARMDETELQNRMQTGAGRSQASPGRGRRRHGTQHLGSEGLAVSREGLRRLHIA